MQIVHCTGLVSQRFHQVEQLAAARNLDWAQLDIDALEQIWQEVKGGTAV